MALIFSKRLSRIDLSHLSFFVATAEPETTITTTTQLTSTGEQTTWNLLTSTVLSTGTVSPTIDFTNTSPEGLTNTEVSETLSTLSSSASTQTGEGRSLSSN